MDQLLDLHRNTHALADASRFGARGRRSGDLFGFLELGMNRQKTSFNGRLDPIEHPWLALPSFIPGRIDAPTTAEVQTFWSNLLAAWAAVRSQYARGLCA
ncbi:MULTISPECIES: hypothetical protein [Bradyrhizobium]|uniref:hypothetical protein n=1 Tax=Bradyrhizobium elkanii TaxID=29448 RepID=UPI0003FF4B43|nr:hypothetical protein [Bradyrhizobium elkanii]